ncbi:hypothetical protein [Azospirillum soli]|uniref:hypothetical protein n=1 Tax=Azospirillum soli TaxID=1304799 RepID=UPI001AEA859C|nr:hypothetical protein [Azospirillum soli]MBP2313447.1 hypothetical protein [Azospirillum soli]
MISWPFTFVQGDNFSNWLVFVFGVFIPASVLAGRYAVKKHRQTVLRNLRATFQHSSNRDVSLFPTFEFALQKYDLAAEPKSKMERVKTWFRATHELIFYVMTMAIFGAISTLGFIYLITYAPTIIWNKESFIYGVPGAQQELMTPEAPASTGTTPPPTPQTTGQNTGGQATPNGEKANPELANYQKLSGAVLGFAFLGAYVWSLMYLVRRISCFDLSPMSFLRASARIVLACTTALVLRHLVPIQNSGMASNLIPLTGFLVGFFPAAGLDLLMQKIPQLRLRRIAPGAAESARSMPLSMIDGIDSEIEFRLAEREITDVQTLATENPVLLCAETPYGLLTCLDWIAQAQLALEVGPEKYRQLRDIGLRSIFALEQVRGDPWLEPVAVRILDPAAATTATLSSRIHAMKSSEHVQRLYQCYDVLNEVFGQGVGAPSREAARDQIMDITLPSPHKPGRAIRLVTLRRPDTPLVQPVNWPLQLGLEAVAAPHPRPNGDDRVRPLLLVAMLCMDRTDVEGHSYSDIASKLDESGPGFEFLLNVLQDNQIPETRRGSNTPRSLLSAINGAESVTLGRWPGLPRPILVVATPQIVLLAGEPTALDIAFAGGLRDRIAGGVSPAGAPRPNGPSPEAQQNQAAA